MGLGRTWFYFCSPLDIERGTFMPIKPCKKARVHARTTQIWTVVSNKLNAIDIRHVNRAAGYLHQPLNAVDTRRGRSWHACQPVKDMCEDCKSAILLPVMFLFRSFLGLPPGRRLVQCSVELQLEQPSHSCSSTWVEPLQGRSHHAPSPSDPS